MTEPRRHNYNYLPQHTTLDCMCAAHIFDDVDNPAVTRLLQTSHIPLINVDLSVSLASFPKLSSSPPIYVAISHARRQGLGNTAANSLPLCQLQRIQRLVDKIYTSTEEGTHVPFWIDTACIPQTEPGKALALECLDKVYRKADTVFVLDTALMEMRAEESMEKITKNIRDSTWGTRLWTVREGALGLRLHFQFRDAVLDLGELNERILTSKSMEPWTKDLDLREIEEMDKHNDAFVDLCQMFERDMRIAFGKVPVAKVAVHEIRIFEAKYKHELRDILCQCYLSTMRYKYFAPKTKKDKFLLAREVVESVYHELSYTELVRVQNVDIRDTLERLLTIWKVMSAG